MAVDRLVGAIRILIVEVVTELGLEGVLADGEVVVHTGVHVGVTRVGVAAGTGAHRGVRTRLRVPGRRTCSTGRPGRRGIAIHVGLAVILVHIGCVVIRGADIGGEAVRPGRQILAQREVGVQQTMVVLVVGSTAGLGDRVLRAGPGGVATASPIAVFVTDGEGGGRDGVDHIPRVDVRTRAAILEQHAEEVEPHVRRRGQVDVHIHTEVAAHILVLRAVTFVDFGPVDETLVGNQVQHREVTEPALAAAELHVEVVGRSRVLEHLVHPVHARIEFRILAALECTEFVVVVLGGIAVVHLGLVGSKGIGVTVHELRLVEQRVEHVIIRELDDTRVLLTALGGQENGTVDSLVTVEGKGGRILEDGDTLDFLGGNIFDIALDTVHQNQRGVVAVERLQTADVERRVHVGDVAGTLQGDQAEALSDDAVADILGLAVADLLRRDDGDGSRALLLGELDPRQSGLDFLLLNLVILCSRRQAEAEGERKDNGIFHFHTF